MTDKIGRFPPLMSRSRELSSGYGMKKYLSPTVVVLKFEGVRHVLKLIFRLDSPPNLSHEP